ncbi:MAG: protein kinase [Planctomycetota bacterium]
MKPSETEPRRDLAADALDVYAARLASLPEGESLDLEQLCRERADLAPELRRLHLAVDQRDRQVEAGAAPVPIGDGPLEALARSQDDERYSMLDEIGRGGMGSVYRVWDARLKRTLAMKVSAVRRGESSERRGDRSLYRFLDEAHVMGWLDHPGVLPVHDAGFDAEGRLFFTMHLVRGHELGRVLRLARQGRDGWNATRVVGVLIKVCETLAYAHGKGILHRDVKPSNVMVGALGETYVTDWGLARVAARPEPGVPDPRGEVRDPDDSRHGPFTVDGAVIGTPSYMAPEQASGRAAAIGPRVDVYAVGAVLYELLAGEPPYADRCPSADAQGVLEEVRRHAPTALVRRAPAAPPELIAICDKAMSRTPARRYGNMESLAADLRAYTERRVVSAHRVGPVVEARKWVDRNRTAALALASALLLLVAGSLAFAWTQAAQRRTVDGVNARLRAQSQRADRSAYAARVSAAAALLEQHHPDFARAQLALCDPALRGWEWHHLDARVDLSRATLDAASDAELTRGVAFSPDGELLAFGDEDGRVFAAAARNASAPRLLGRVADRVYELKIDPHERWIVAAGKREVGFFSFDPAVPPRILRPGGGNFRDVAFRPGTDTVAVSAQDGKVRLLDAPTGAIVGSFYVGGRAGIGFGPNPDELFSLAADSRVRVHDPETGEVLRERELLDEPAYSHHCLPLAVGPRGDVLAVGTPQGEVQLLDAASLDRIAVLDAHTGYVWSIAFSPDGRRLATASSDGTVRVWDAGSGALGFVGHGHRARVTAVAWSPAGDALATTGEDALVRLWDPDGSEGESLLLPHSFGARKLDVSPDGARIASAGPQPGVLLWDPESGDCQARLEWDKEDAVACRFDRTGRRLCVGTTDGRLLIWDVERAVVEREVKLADTWVEDIDLHGGRIAASTSDGLLAVLDLGTGAAIAQLRCGAGRVGALRFAPDGEHLVVGPGGEDLLVIETAGWTVARRRPAPHGDLVHSIRFHPDGSSFVTSGADERVLVWSTQTWELERELRGHSESVHATAFSPDGTRLATGGVDQSLRLWDFASGSVLATLGARRNWITALAFAPDGSWLCAGNNLRLWDSTRRERGLNVLHRVRSKLRVEVDELFALHHRSQAVVEALGRRADLSPVELRAAIWLARSKPDGPRTLRDAARALALEPGSADELYVRALEKARASLALDPDPRTLEVEALALARLGRTDEARDALRRADGRRDEPEPGDAQAEATRTALRRLLDRATPDGGGG